MKLINFLFGRWYGALLLWSVTAVAILLTPWFLDTGNDFAWLLLGEWCAMAAIAAVVLVLFVTYLLRRKWKDAVKLFFASLGCAIVFPICIFICFFFGGDCMPKPVESIVFPPEREPWCSSAITEKIPFSIEFRRVHSCDPEHERRIRFRSGKCRDLKDDAGGAWAFAVWAAGPDEFIIVDCLEKRPGNAVRCIYRVNVAQEKVKPASGPFEGLKYVGLVRPGGSVKHGGKPPASWHP